MPKIVIIGAGPTGLGAGYCLKDNQFDDFVIYERNQYVGGLSASFKKNGYTVDIGGHVLFSHYKYFDQAVAEALKGQYLEHVREAWIWMQKRFIPYPFQNNIKYLPPEMVLACLKGLLNIETNPQEAVNFEEWVEAIFGEGIADYFMKPYNFKVWAHPLNLLSKDWIAERVSVVDFQHTLENVILDKTEASWGPNNTFKFPLFGGTGAIFEGISQKLRDKIIFNKEVASIDTVNKRLRFSDGSEDKYEILINTAPLDKFMLISDAEDQYKNATQDLLHSDGYSISLGFNRKLDDDKKTKCWNYFPENDNPFYRVTYLSNYSPNMVPDINNNFLLMCEVSSSEFKKHSTDTIIDETIQGLLNSKFISERDRDLIDFKDLININYSYPIPSINRDRALDKIIPYLENKSIFSRGRFGMWRYEAGNMDHSFMQGVEVIDRILHSKKEETIFKN